MNRKYLLALTLAITALGAIGFFISNSNGDGPVAGRVTAQAPKEGVVVPGTDEKVRAFENGVFTVEPSSFAVSQPARDIQPPTEAEMVERRKNPGFRARRKQEQDKKREEDRIAKDLPPLSETDKNAIEINEQNAKAIKRAKPGAAESTNGFVDPLLPTAEQAAAPEAMPTPLLTFDGGLSSENGPLLGFTVAPPDVNGDVGPNHYVSSTNMVIKIFNKSGGLISGPFLTGNIWDSLPASDPCRTEDDGDPIVLYDQLADRWHISQFAVPANNFRQCVAVSVTGDPTGSYYVWSYPYPGGLFNDYPKVGVWNDAYHMTFNQFNAAGTVFLGLGIFSQDRAKALAGDPTAGVVYKNVATVDPDAGGALPLDVEGFVPPPANLPVVIGEFRANEYGDPLDAIRFYKWVPDFANPANTVFSVLNDVALAAFNPLEPGGRNDIEQFGTQTLPATPASLDSLSGRLMHRLVYRNRGTYEAPVNSIVGSFTVNTSGLNPTNAANYDASVRWFELRRNGDAFSVFDQGTQANAAGTAGTRLNNWMSSISQDNQGNLGLGYSQSGPTQRANIMIAGRTINNGTAGTMNEGEALMHAATGSQTADDPATTGTTEGTNRWGDYSTMSVDPADDCTFWYTQEYYGANSGFGWRTRVGSFKFPSCSAPPKGTIAGTVTSCSSGVPIDKANVTTSNGFHRLTVANGTYSMEVTPGNYSVDAFKRPRLTGRRSECYRRERGNDAS